MAFGDGLSDITPFLQRKYAIQQQTADAASTNAGAAVTRANSGAAVDYANAGQIAPDAVAKRALEGAQTGVINTEIRKANALQPVYDYQGQNPAKSVYDALGQSGLWGRGAGPYAGGGAGPYGGGFKFTDGGFYGGSTFDKTGGLGSGMVTPAASSVAPAAAAAAAAPAAVDPNLVTGDSLLNRASPSMARGIRTSVGLPHYKSSADDLSKPLGFSKGTAKVPGKTPKSGNTDIVPAKLTPGEAVLNKGAAEHVGRGLIDHLNAIGMAKMGMPEPKGKGKAKAAPKAAKGAPQAFAEGTSNVQPVPTTTSELMLGYPEMMPMLRFGAP